VSTYYDWHRDDRVAQKVVPSPREVHAQCSTFTHVVPSVRGGSAANPLVIVLFTLIEAGLGPTLKTSNYICQGMNSSCFIVIGNFWHDILLIQGLH